MASATTAVMTFRKSIRDTIAYYRAMKDDHTAEIAELEKAYALSIGDPAAQKGVDLASAYYRFRRNAGLLPVNRATMTNYQRAIQNSINRHELFNSAAHPAKDTVARLRRELRKTQRKAPVASTVPYIPSFNRLAFNRRRTSKATNTPYKPKHGYRLAENARRQSSML